MRYLSYIVMFYMLLALIWWSILLHEKNKEIFDFKIELITLQAEKNGTLLTAVENTAEYKIIQDKFERQNMMIMGESMVFGFLLILGMWFIQKAFNKELESNNKVKNFLLSITHELKSPIASINLVLDTLVKRELPHLTVKELSSDALIESNRLEKLINNILLSIKVNEAYQYNFENVSLKEFIEKIIKKSAFNIPVNNIGLDLAHKQEQINVDPEAFFSVLNNLIENAIKYGDEKPIVISTSDDDKHFYIEVKDEGSGIDDNNKKKVFEQFYRVGDEATRNTKGTGLGLYIVKKIINAHSGSISIENNIPCGSVFKIIIPK